MAGDPVAGKTPTPTPARDDDMLGHDELKRRASAGIFIVATRGLAILAIGFGGTVVVARLLTPRDFGVVALGMVLVLVAGLLSDGDLGAALIRRREPPDVRELEALTAFQLVVTIAIAGATAAAAPFLGEVGWIAALMVCSMPFVAVQFPGRILLERSLAYRPLAVIEVAQVLTYHAWAIGFVLAGFGVWGLASATVAMRVTSALLMARLSPVGLVRPRFSWRRIRPLIGFGARFQAASATWLARDQGLIVLIPAITSVATLGLWTLARRLLEVPLLLFESLWRVSFPTMSQLLAAKRDPALLIERSAAMTAIGSGTILTALAGASPGLLPGLFGEQWAAASGVVPVACLALGIRGSVSVATVGYLYAIGDATAVLRASLFEAAVLLGVALPLLPVLGVTAVGVGWVAAAVVEVAVLANATRRWTKARLLRPLAVPMVVGVVAGSAGWLVADVGGRDLASGAAGAASSVLCFQVGLLLLNRKLLFDTARFAAASVRAAARRTAAGAA
jgi:O-antigen/teichoic acid export membrane protein